MFPVSGLSNTKPVRITTQADNWVMADMHGQPVIPAHRSNVGYWIDELQIIAWTDIHLFNIR